jgi:Cof subfamily protein (haloacid dehalogenase superfamily)
VTERSRYKLLLTDVDGTLVRKDGSISEENLAALRAAHEAGVCVSICTGRSMLSSKEQIEKLGFGGFHAFYDGGFICHGDSGEVLHAGAIPPAAIRRLIEFAAQHSLYLELSNGLRSFAALPCPVPKLKSLAFEAEHTTGSLERIEDRERIVQGLLVVQSEREGLIEALRQELAPGTQIVHGPVALTSGLDPCVVLAGGTSKGSAIARFCEYHGITPDEVMAVGDWMNDISMLKEAGLGVAMGQAPDEVKAAADCITGSVNEHGLAEAIRKYLLPGA